MTEKILRHRILLDAKLVHHPYWAGKRITFMLNEAQKWLQLELLKQGYNTVWKEEADLSFGSGTVLGITGLRATLPTDMLLDVPPISISTNIASGRPIRVVDDKDWVDNITNIYSVPTTRQPMGIIVDGVLFVYPTGITSGKILYYRLITDLDFDDDTTESEIPSEHQDKLIQRVIADIKAIEAMDEQTRQAKIGKIEQEIAKRYQLSPMAPESEQFKQDKKVLG